MDLKCYWILLLICARVRGIPERLLFDFDSPEAKELPRENDVSSDEIFLKVPISFYGMTYKTIYVNSNGFISFQTEIPQFINIEFPLDYAIIAPFYSNVDTTGAGTISYFETQDPGLLNRATEDIHESFIEAADFRAKSLFIVTWNGVGYYDGRHDKLNTYQAVIITDGRESYAEFLYPDNGIQWIQGTGDQSGLVDARAQVGFLSPEGKMHLLPGSSTEYVRKLDKWSNVGLPGQYIFKINGQEIIEPDGYGQKENGLYPLTCAEVPTACHSQAVCIDYKEGYCCECNPSFIGNGKFCIKDGEPLRVIGKVNGKINGERLENLDLQSYIILTDGRAYTAVSKVPESIGGDIQTLQVIGSTIGYLLAKPVRGAVNGFQKSGGLINHTATITFLNTTQVVRVNQKFLGLDVFDQLKVIIDIQGEIPTLPPDSRVQIEEYQEQYTQTDHNLIQMTADRTFYITTPNGEQVANVFRIEQSFIFDSCPFKNNTNLGDSWTLKVGSNFISYESREQIIRFGVNNKIVPIGDFNPCIEGGQTCGPYSACVVEGNSFECVCNLGYYKIYSQNNPTCVDENECQTNHNCDSNAQCHNTEGSYQCLCNPGFEGDGKICSPVNTCANISCRENAQCVQSGEVAECRCLPGFRGDGLNCQPVTSQDCDMNNNCSPYGICSIDPATNQFSCHCHPGFEGDGYYCVPRVTNPIPTSTVAPISTTESYVPITDTYDQRLEPQCDGDVCLCPNEYFYDSDINSCVPEISGKESNSSSFSVDCRTLNNCDSNAWCGYNELEQGFFCHCNEGFEGNGFNCQEERKSCQELNNCDPHALCTYNETIGQFRCVCSPGYAGDGYHCAIATTCSSSNDCAPTEDCLYQNGRYECLCKEGYSRDSQQICVAMSALCGGGYCVENAECLYDEEFQTFYCYCKRDYVGDGITSCQLKQVGCDTLNNCGLHARCQYEEQVYTYVCKCNPGFFGDGFNCFAQKNCLTEPTLCDRNAFCSSDADRKYVCQCNQGFIGNGSSCKPISREEGNFLLLNQGWATHKIPMAATPRDPGKPIQIKAYQTAVGLDIDCLEGRVYWSDIMSQAIRSSLYNGSDNRDFIKTEIGSPEGLSIDWVSRNIYWTDSTKKTIEVANLDSKRRRVLFRTGLVNPRGITVHPQRGKIFWSDWDRSHPKIEWANADGTDRSIFLEGPAVSLPNSLAIDFDTDQLCYPDAGTKNIECVQIDNRQIQTIAINCTYPFGITITDKMVFWSDWISKKIERVDKYTLQRLPSLNVPAGGSGNKLFGLVAVPNSCPKLSNLCQYTTCQEEHICLPDGKGSKRCVCARLSDSTQEPGCTL
ncbi:nidogen [Anthonomus grandis grandis]|uniref:nidogen n=1 Tax=Anthonomus grandis grandis TaxID=2921223 RepID=UPI00216634E6|nr:nidogen [Anthonomus grandis grandis]